MKLQEPEKQFFDDYEHKVSGKINKYGDRPDFPKMETFGIDRQELDGYLFDQQAIMDMEGTPRTQYTVAGCLIVLPVIILACFPEKSFSGSLAINTVGAVIVGVILWLIKKSVCKMIINIRLSRMRIRKLESYIHAVLSYEEKAS